MEERNRILWQAFGLFGVLVLLRALGTFNVYFFEEDEISLAVGAAALVRDGASDFYRYTPQLGYYRLVEGLCRLLGGQVDAIPWILRGLSVFSGALIPTLGLFLFRDVLTRRQAWLLAGVLAINPIVWKSSQYGNTGILAAAVAGLAITIFSNGPARAGRLLAFLLYGTAVLIRADAILVSPVIAFLLYRQRGSVVRALVPCGAFAVALAAVYAAIFWLDPRLDDALASVATHVAATSEHYFWEYLVWAVSPLSLGLALWGARGLLERAPALLVALLAWMLPTMAFYFPATSTPRYFLGVAIPLSIATAIGIEDLAKRLATWWSRRLAWLVALGLASVHLFVGLGHFHGRLLAPFLGPEIGTHDRGMPTGALLYATYLRRGFLWQSLGHGGFGATSWPHWEGPLFSRVLGDLAAWSGPPRRVVFLIAGGWAHAFHYHAHVAGARYESVAPSDASAPFHSLTEMQLGATRIVTLGRPPEYLDSVERFELAAGDQLWVMGEPPTLGASELARVPAGLRTVPAGDRDGRIWMFDLVDETP